MIEEHDDGPVLAAASGAMGNLLRWVRRERGVDPEGGEGRNLERADTKKIPRQIEIKVHKLHSRVDQGVL